MCNLLYLLFAQRWRSVCLRLRTIWDTSQYCKITILEFSLLKQISCTFLANLRSNEPQYLKSVISIECMLFFLRTKRHTIWGQYCMFWLFWNCRFSYHYCVTIGVLCSVGPSHSISESNMRIVCDEDGCQPTFAITHFHMCLKMRLLGSRIYLYACFAPGAGSAGERMLFFCNWNSSHHHILIFTQSTILMILLLRAQDYNKFSICSGLILSAKGYVNLVATSSYVQLDMLHAEASNNAV